ncbi:MAG: LCP family protein [candidate division WOR-3 bacterium]
MASRRTTLLLQVLIPLGIALLIGLGVYWYLFVPRQLRRGQNVLSGDSAQVFNILIIGKDARALKPSEDSGTRRIRRQELCHSDIVIVCHINPSRRILNLVALPRDLLVEIPGHTRAASRTDFTNMDKLTHTYCIGGEPLLRRTVEQLLGIRIQRYIAFDFDSFRMLFDLLRPLVGRLNIDGRNLSARDEALKFARQRNGLRYDDLDRCRNALKLIRALAASLWRFAGTRTAEYLLKQAFAIIGTDTDLTTDEALRLIDALRQNGFSPSRIESAVLVSEGRPVTLWRYDMTLSCYLPHYPEIEKQIKRYLLDSLHIPALDFMTQQHYHWPDYMTTDYVLLLPTDSLASQPESSVTLDSARLATRLAELRAQGLNPESLLLPTLRSESVSERESLSPNRLNR